MLKSKIKKYSLKFAILNFGLLVLVCGLWVFSGAQEERRSVKKRRDPFIPLVTADGRLLKLEIEEEGEVDLELEGIVYDKAGLSYAIVNTEVVRIGDVVGQYQVFKIEKNKVIFLKEGQPREVELKKEEP